MQHMHLSALASTIIFKDCSRGLLTALVRTWRTEVFMEQEFIFREGDLGECMHYIEEGYILLYHLQAHADDEVIDDDSDEDIFSKATQARIQKMASALKLDLSCQDVPQLNIFSEVTKGALIGEMSLAFRQPRAAGAVSATVVITHSMNRSDLCRCIASFEFDQAVVVENLEALPQLTGSDVWWDDLSMVSLHIIILCTIILFV
jgi:CRP-like cAMP-binding protein